MTNPMIERVVAAIAFELRRQSDEPDIQSPMVGPGLGDDLALEGYFNLKAITRAAIEAMREPTEAMRIAGYENAEHTLKSMGRDHPSGEESCGNIFSAMIDAALKED
jgi:hypothetical protein